MDLDLNYYRKWLQWFRLLDIMGISFTVSVAVTEGRFDQKGR